ncbi:amidase [Rhodococcus qingshengii]|uniref:amidase n=1 Tax=Rhodococcus qingshengii TaxID=334542 RepID=UPI0036DEBDCA
MSDELCTLTAVEQADLVRRREVSAVELLEAHLDRVDRLNPTVNAIVTRDDEAAYRAAREADRRLAVGHGIGPLHGLPVAHKDTHATAGLRTTWGSPLQADTVPAEDELVVARIRAAGAIRVGKTNVPEWAAGSHTTNPIFGPTRNPYDLRLSAGGSSGGAAAALAVGMVPLAEGSDMGGSLRNPAAFCNVVGLRPTPGRVPMVPAELGWQTLPVQGPLGRTVADVALLLSVIAGPDSRATVSLDESGSVFREPLGIDLRGLRVAWAPDLGGRIPTDRAILGVLNREIKVFEALGAEITETCPDLAGADESFDILRAMYFAVNLGDAVREHPDQVNDMVRWNVERGRMLSAIDVGRALLAKTRLHEQVRRFFSEFDILLCPSTQVLPFDVDVDYPRRIEGQHMHDYLEWMRACSLISATGCPAVSVPGGFTTDGLPVGLQIVAAPRADRQLLDVAHTYEQATRHGLRRPACDPTLLPAVDTSLRIPAVSQHSH